MKALLLAFLALVGSACAADLTLAWDPAPAAEAVTRYRVYAVAPDGGRTLVVETSATTVTIQSPGGVTLVVTALSWAESVPSAPLVIPPLPGAPQGLRWVLTLSLTPAP